MDTSYGFLNYYLKVTLFDYVEVFSFSFLFLFSFYSLFLCFFFYPFFWWDGGGGGRETKRLLLISLQGSSENICIKFARVCVCVCVFYVCMHVWGRLMDG